MTQPQSTPSQGSVAPEHCEAHIAFNVALQKYELTVGEEVVSVSKHKDYWEYHQRRGDLPKVFECYYFTKFTYHNQPATVSKISRNLSCSLVDLLEPLYIHDILEPEQPKKRGRPKKVTIQANDSCHRLSDDEPTDDPIKVVDKHDIRAEFKRLTEVMGMSPTQACEEIANTWIITYRQAYTAAHS